ncbi:hypothetical protein UFOVP901_24 [uncultured Caudovirales phage]|uniref:Uncharacterized protein n=1 Tax=uncultured Caudovirales phage TaxID=2100421 RepID=A0A6J5PDK1_9CAUD|nr:hypothetical protein UFOVP901_24 [uncultured Caudovirales phage]
MTQVTLVDAGTKWVTFSPTVAGFGAAPTATAYYMRVGSTMILKMRIRVNNTSGAGAYTVSMPTGFNIDSSKQPLADIVASAAWSDTVTTGATFAGRVYLNNSTSGPFQFYGGNGQAVWSASVPSAVVVGTTISVEMTLPILEWA